jgi:hypothetical protein
MCGHTWPRHFNGVQPQNSGGCFEFHVRCYAADAHVGSLVVVRPEPIRGLFLRPLNSFKDVLIQPFMPDRSVVSLDISVLLQPAGLDVRQSDIVLLSPFHQLLASGF